MILRYYGHSLFTVALSCGKIIAADPYYDFYQYPNRSLPVDICTISHHHADHDSINAFQKNPVIIDTAGVHFPFDGICITGIPTFHDDEGGIRRGNNLVFILEAEGLRIVHLGDLGHPLSAEQISAIGKPDILLLPVGGYYTINAQTALGVMQSLSPKVAIPMHYRTRACDDMPIAPLADFLQLTGASPQPMSLCRVTAEDISQRPSLLIMTTPEGD